jgi:hypothetical protein
VDAYDERIVDLNPLLSDRALAAYRNAERTLRERWSAERDAVVRTDLEILLDATHLRIDRIELEQRYELPFVDVAAIVFRGLSTLLDDGVAPARRRAARVRLQRYVGAEQGYRPLTELAMQRTRERLDVPGLLFPAKARVENVLAKSPVLVEGLSKLLAKSRIADHEELLGRLREQLVAYAEFLRTNVLPRARTDFRQPTELYRLALRESGIDAPPLEFARRARIAFEEVRAEMQLLAPKVARERGLPSTDYRDVLRALKTDQLEGEALIAVYRRRMEEIDAIIQREHLMALPAGAMRLRMATEAESSRMRAPFFDVPRPLDHASDQGAFVLPRPRVADSDDKLDDFSFEAASWWLTAHEGHPGHGLQFSTMLQKKVSVTRAVFAFNSVNAEGWGLYAEDLIRPFMPIAAQLVCLQARLMRAAHAFLDIELNFGLLTPNEARRVLREDAVFSEAWARESVDRYTFKWPGQAPSYFYGYVRLMALREETARAMGSRFDLQRFHEFVLAQGLVSPSLLRKAVFADLVGRGG